MMFFSRIRFGGTDRPFLMSMCRWPRILQVDGEHQRAALRRDCALDQRLAEAAVLHDVELEPERLLDIGGDVLDRADRHGRERVRDAGCLRRAAGKDFAVADLHAGGADRREDQRHARVFAEDFVRWSRTEMSTRMRWRNLIASRSARLARSVSSRIGAVIDIVEKRLRHLAPVQFAQILDAGDVLHCVLRLRPASTSSVRRVQTKAGSVSHDAVSRPAYAPNRQKGDFAHCARAEPRHCRGPLGPSRT